MNLKPKYIILFLSCTLTLAASCQNKIENNSSKTDHKMSKSKNNMETPKLTNPIVKSAIEALSLSDKVSWYSHFTSDAVFTDDGNKQDFKTFFDNAINHKEKFLTIDKVENDGKDIIGNFFAGQWGTFKVFFKFTINSDAKISRLDIGQAK